MIYDFPTATGSQELDSDIIATLAEHPNIVCTKLSCGNIGTYYFSLFFIRIRRLCWAHIYPSSRSTGGAQEP